MFNSISRFLATHSGRIARVAAVALGAYMLLINALYYKDTTFVWSATAHLPQTLRTILDPNFWFHLLTTAGFIAALWTTGALFDSLKEKALFRETFIDALNRIGLCLIFGALTAMLKLDLILDDARHTMGFITGFEVNDHDIPIAAIGAAFLLIAYQARRLRSRLDQFV